MFKVKKLKNLLGINDNVGNIHIKTECVKLTTLKSFKSVFEAKEKLIEHYKEKEVCFLIKINGKLVKVEQIELRAAVNKENGAGLLCFVAEVEKK